MSVHIFMGTVTYECVALQESVQLCCIWQWVYKMDAHTNKWCVNLHKKCVYQRMACISLVSQCVFNFLNVVVCKEIKRYPSIFVVFTMGFRTFSMTQTYNFKTHCLKLELILYKKVNWQIILHTLTNFLFSSLVLIL